MGSWISTNKLNIIPNEANNFPQLFSYYTLPFPFSDNGNGIFNIRYKGLHCDLPSCNGQYLSDKDSKYNSYMGDIYNNAPYYVTFAEVEAVARERGVNYKSFDSSPSRALFLGSIELEVGIYIQYWFEGDHIESHNVSYALRSMKTSTPEPLNPVPSGGFNSSTANLICTNGDVSVINNYWKNMRLIPIWGEITTTETTDSSSYSKTIQVPAYIGIGLSNDGKNYFRNSSWGDWLYDEMQIDRPWYNSEVNSPEFGSTSGTGGYEGGTFDDSSDTVGVPPMPTVGVTTTGFVNLYQITTGSLITLGSELFPEFTKIEPPETVTDIAETIVNLTQNVISAINMYSTRQLIDYVLDVHILPVKAQTAPKYSDHIDISYKEMTATGEKLSSDYVDFDCGTLNVGEYYGNFADYGSFTTAKLYLPFVGFIPIKSEFWQSGELSVIYRFNLIDGSFMAFVVSSSSKSKLKDTVIGQYGGNASVHIPITGLNYSNLVSGIANGVAGVASGLSSGNPGSAVGSALNALSVQPQMQSSNSYNSTSSFLGVRTPYLLIERTVSNFSQNFPNERGLPCNITTDFSDLSGFTIATDEQLDGFNGATKDELQMVQSALASGVIF